MKGLLISATLISTAIAANPSLIPWPSRIALGQDRLVIDSGFSVVVDAQDPRLALAVTRFVARLSRQTGIPIQEAFGPISGRVSLTIHCAAPASGYPKLGDDESYQLEVSAAGATLTAPISTGVLRGLETLAQLVEAGPDGFSCPASPSTTRRAFPGAG